MSTQHTLTLPLSHSQAKNVMLLVLRSYHIIIQDQWLCVPKGNALDAVKPCSCSAGIHRRHSAHHLSQITIKLASPWPGPHDVIRKMVDSLTVSSRCICGASLHAAAVQDLHETHPGECNIPVKGLTIYLLAHVATPWHWLHQYEYGPAAMGWNIMIDLVLNCL